MNLPEKIEVILTEEDMKGSYSNPHDCPLYRFLKRSEIANYFTSAGYGVVINKSVAIYDIPTDKWNPRRWEELQGDPLLLKNFKFTITRIK